MDPDPETQRGGVEAVDRALVLLTCFQDGPASLGLAELAHRSGLNKSTILRICVSLLRRGFLERGEDGRYRIGPTLWRLGACYRDGLQLPSTLRPELHRLCRDMGETASFYVRDGDTRLCLFREEPARAIRHTLQEGASLPLSYGATALVLRAFGPDGERDLGEVRQAGHAITHGARDPDVAAVAVPVRRQATLLGALALSGPVHRFDASHVDQMIRVLKQSADRIVA